MSGGTQTCVEYLVIMKSPVRGGYKKETDNQERGRNKNPGGVWVGVNMRGKREKNSDGRR